MNDIKSSRTYRMSHLTEPTPQITTRRKYSQISYTNLDQHIGVCTAKYESQKRKCLMIEQAREQVEKEYQQMLAKLAEVKAGLCGCEPVHNRARIKTLEAGLQNAINKYHEALSFNNTLKAEIDEKRINKKNIKERELYLNGLLHDLQQSKQQMEKDNKKHEQTCNGHCFILRDMLFQNNSEKQHYKNRLQTQYTSLNTKPKSLYNIEDTIMMESLSLVKFRIKLLKSSNRTLSKQIETYTKLLQTIDNEFKVIFEKSSHKTLEEVTSQFIRSEQRNTCIKDNMNYLSKKVQEARQQNCKLEQLIQNEIKLKKMLEQKQLAQKQSKFQQDSKIQSSIQSSQLIINRVKNISSIVRPKLLQVLEFLFNHNSFSNQTGIITDISEQPLISQLSILEKYLNQYVELKCMGQSQVSSRSSQKNILFIRKEAPLAEVSASDDKYLMEKEELKRFAKNTLTKKPFDKSEKYINNVSWVK